MRRVSGSVTGKWIVESDYLWPEQTEWEQGRITWPVDESLRGEHQQPWRYLGRTTKLEAGNNWTEDPHAEHLPKLTAMGYGEPTFHAVYPNCQGVFGMHDDDFGDTTTGLEYEVFGRYSDSNADPINHLASDVSAAIDELGWVWNPSEVPDQTICYGRVTFTARGTPLYDPQTQQLNETTTLSVGNTGTESLSAWLASEISSEDGTDPKQIENQLEALKLDAALGDDRVDLGSRFENARHRHTFGSHSGGTLWTLRPRTPAKSSRADAGNFAAAHSLALPDHLAADLDAINRLQAAVDRAAAQILSLRRQIFSDWYKYMVCCYRADDARRDYPPIDETRQFVAARISLLKLLQAYAGTPGEPDIFTPAGLAVLSRDVPPSMLADFDSGFRDWVARIPGLHCDPSLSVQLTVALGRFQSPPDLELAPSGAPRFWQPNDPDVLLEGPGVQPSNRHGADSLLPCDVLTPGHAATLIQALETDLAAFKAAHADLSTWTQHWADDTLKKLLTTDQQNDVSANLGPAPTGFSETTGNPWHPLFLEWDVAVQPVGPHGNLHGDREYKSEFIKNNYTLSETKSEFLRAGASAAPAPSTSFFTGRSILTDHARTILKTRISDYLTKNSAQTGPLINTLKLAHKKLDGAHIQSQALDGFNAALLMHRQTQQLPIDDPINFEDYRAFSKKIVHDAVGRQNRVAPMPDWDFHPLRTGRMKFNRLRLVDTFGRTAKVAVENPVTTSQMVDRYGQPDWIDLPARITQPARLNFRFLSAADGRMETNAHPLTSPICGWLVSNNLDGSLMIYDGAGEPLGYIDLEGHWRKPPGRNGPAVPQDIENEPLRNMVGWLCQKGQAVTGFITDFVAAVDTALQNIAPRNFAQHEARALLMSRPVALVRAAVGFEVQGLPAASQSWDDYRHELTGAKPQTEGFCDVRLPVRIGEYEQLNDGVVGYWIENPSQKMSPWQPDEFFAPQSSVTSADANITVYRTGNLNFHRSINDPITIVSMLVDPRGSVHCTTGILPTSELTIPTEHYATALKSLNVTFLSSPLLVEQDQIRLPLPTESGWGWSWVQKDGPAWTEITTTPVLERQSVITSFSAHGLKIWELLIKGGFLKPVDPTQTRATVQIKDRDRLSRPSIKHWLTGKSTQMGHPHTTPGICFE